MSSKTRKLALDLFQARPSHLQETSARNTREKASLRNGQWPASATEKETQRSLFQWFGTHMGKDCPDSHLAPALPGQRACIQYSVPRHCHTLAFTAQHNQTNAQQPGYARAHSPRVHNLGSPPGTPPACVRARGSPISPLRHTHLVRTPTRPGLPRQPRGRARGQRAPPHGYLCDPPPFHGRSRGAPTAPSPAWARPGSRASQASSAKAPAVRSQTPGTKARREWRAPRGRPPSDTN